MHFRQGHHPSLVRLLVALSLALGLLGTFAGPTLAQDDEPAPEDQPVQAADVEQQDVGSGTLRVRAYLCNGDVGFRFDVGIPNVAKTPPPAEEECSPTSNVDGTDMTFLVYEFGDLNGSPQEVTTVNGEATLDLPVTSGTPHLIKQKLPPDAVEPAVQATFEIEDGVETVVDAMQYQVGRVELHKFECSGDPAQSSIVAGNPGEPFDDTPYAACEPADRGFTITLFGDAQQFGTVPATTTGGSALIEDVPTTTQASGPHAIAEDGTTLTGTFEVEPGTTTVIVVVNNLEPTGDLTITKLVCVGTDDTQFYIDQNPPQSGDPECAPAAADFSIYPFGDTNSAPIETATGDNGSVDVVDLPVTDGNDPHLLVEDATGAETTFEVHDGGTTVVNVVNFVPPPPKDGTLELEKLECSGITKTRFVIGDPGDKAAKVPSNCSSSSAQFLVYPFGDKKADPIELGVEGFASLDLPPTDGTPHLLVELDDEGNPVAKVKFEIESETVTPIQVRNVAYGSVKVYAFLCVGEDDPEFEVFAPGEAVDLPDDCDAFDRPFDITLFGEDPSSDVTVTVETGDDGIVTLGVPATNAARHLIERGDIAWTYFAVQPHKTTVVVYVVDVPEEEEDDDTEDSENVEEAPDTGTGGIVTSGTPGTLLFGLAGVVTLAGLAAAIRRRAA